MSSLVCVFISEKNVFDENRDEISSLEAFLFRGGSSYNIKYNLLMLKASLPVCFCTSPIDYRVTQVGRWPAPDDDDDYEGFKAKPKAWNSKHTYFCYNNSTLIDTMINMSWSLGQKVLKWSITKIINAFYQQELAHYIYIFMTVETNHSHIVIYVLHTIALFPFPFIRHAVMWH